MDNYDNAKELVVVMQKCQSCKCYFFEPKICNLCPDCREKNRKGTNLMTKYIGRMRRR